MNKIDDLIEALKDEIAVLQHQKDEVEQERDKFLSWWKWWRSQRNAKAKAASMRAHAKVRDIEQRRAFRCYCNRCGLPENVHGQGEGGTFEATLPPEDRASHPFEPQ